MPTKSKASSEVVSARLKKAQKAAEDGAAAMAEHHANARAVDEKTARLKSLRLAKEAGPESIRPRRNSPRRSSVTRDDK